METALAHKRCLDSHLCGLLLPSLPDSRRDSAQKRSSSMSFTEIQDKKQSLRPFLLSLEGMKLSEKDVRLSSVRSQFDLVESFLNDLFDVAWFEYEEGHFEDCKSLLCVYRKLVSSEAISTSPDRQLSAVWGSLSCHLIMCDWLVAAELLVRIWETLENLRNGLRRKAGVHFPFFVNLAFIPLLKLPKISPSLSNLILSDHSVSIISLNAPHLIPYLVVESIISGDLKKCYDIAIFLEKSHEFFRDAVDLMVSMFVKVNPDLALICLEKFSIFLSKDTLPIFQLSARKKILCAVLTVQVSVSWDMASKILPIESMLEIEGLKISHGISVKKGSAKF